MRWVVLVRCGVMWCGVVWCSCVAVWRYVAAWHCDYPVGYRATLQPCISAHNARVLACWVSRRRYGHQRLRAAGTLRELRSTEPAASGFSGLSQLLPPSGDDVAAELDMMSSLLRRSLLTVCRRRGRPCACVGSPSSVNVGCLAPLAECSPSRHVGSVQAFSGSTCGWRCGDPG